MRPTVQYSSRDSSHPQSLAVGDFNNDGHMDIAVANTGFDNITIFLGYDNNSFPNQTSYFMGTGSVPRMVAVGHLNNDTRLDIVVANFGTNSIEILFGNGNGSFPNQRTIVTSPSRPLRVTVGDFDNDGCSDIAFVGYGTNKIDVLMRLEDGTFSTATNLFTGYDSLPYAIAVGDLNNDGRLDIVVANYGTDNVGLFLGHGNGNFSDQILYPTGASSDPYSIAISDLDNDNLFDIAVANSNANNIKLFFQSGNGTFRSSTLYYRSKTSNPIFVAIADFNNDNISDITMVSNNTNRVVLFIGYGDGTFADPVLYSTGPRSTPYSIGIADFNGDHQLDFAIANQQNSNIKIFNSHTNETFATERSFATSKNSSSIGMSFISLGPNSDPFSLAVGDLDNDNQLDIVVANYRTSTIAVIFGYKNGRFSSPTFYPTGDGAHSNAVIVADFNNDGQLDIAVANMGRGNVGIFLGSGSGEFSRQKKYSTGTDSEPISIVAGDFNNDDRLDIAVASSGLSNIGILLGLGNGDFSFQTTFSTGNDSYPASVTVGDFNNDGQLDIAVANRRTDNIGILLGYGDGNFSSQRTYFIGINSQPTSIVAADFNKDSRLDIAVTNGGADNVGILLGDGKGKFSPQTSYLTDANSGPVSLVVGDFNNDTILDIGVANHYISTVSLFLGYGNGTFSPQTVYSIGDDMWSLSIAAGDFDNDNCLDIAVANQWAQNIVLLRGQGTGKFPYITYSSGIFVYSMRITVGDFNNDGQQDIAVVNQDMDSIGVLLGYGNGNFQNPVVLSTGNTSNPITIATGDFNNDRQLDIAVANSGTKNIGIFLGHGDGQFSPQITYYTGFNSKPISVAVTDVNSDGRHDLVFADPSTKTIGIFLADVNGKFSPLTGYPTGNNSEPLSIVIADFNNDSWSDIAFVNVNISYMGILLGHGNGTFQNMKIFSTGTFTRPVSLAVGDLNNDGNTDIVAASNLPLEEHIQVLLGDGRGNFSNYGRYITGSDFDLYSVIVGHFNNDRQLDIAFVNNSTNKIGVFVGYGDGTFSSQIIQPFTGKSHPVSIVAGDFNNDNLGDFAVADYEIAIVDIFLGLIDTNFVGNATFPTGSAAFPGALALGDFTNDGHLDIVVGNDGTHDIDLFISDGNGSFSMQTLYSGDSTFYSTSIAVHDFNNDSRLDLAIVNSATDTVILLYGEPNGTFRNSSVFSTEIYSSPQSIVTGDFNNDNKTDLALAYSGSGDVGLFLKIDIGALETMQNFSTGSGSKPHGLAVADFDNDGRLDIAVANNGNASIGFFFGCGNGSFSEQESISLGEDIFPQWVGTGDFNNDGQIDVVVSTNMWVTPVIVLLGNYNRSFQIQKTYGVEATFLGEVGDFDVDGYLDVVLCQPWSDSIAVLFGYGNGTFGNPMIFSTDDTTYWLSVAVDDFNNDSRLDIAVTNPNKQSISIFFGYGNRTFSSQIIYSMDQRGFPTSIVTGDFNNDGQVDIAVTTFIRGNFGIFFGYGNGSFQPVVMYSIGDGSFAYSIKKGDFNNDGQLDIIIANSDDGNLAMILGHFNGSFFQRIIYPTGNHSYPYSMGLGDFNNDGRLDIAVSNMFTDEVGVFVGYAVEDFASTATQSIGESSKPVSIAVGDLDNDACLDMVVADQRSNGIVVLQGSGHGTFSSKTAYPTGYGSHPSWVAINDFNDDQYFDIAVVNSGTSNIGIFLGTGNGTFLDVVTSSTGNSSSPVSFTVGHFNDDTHLDIAVANFGSNNVCLMFGYGNGSFTSPECRTSGYDSRPSAVVSGDVNGDNLTDVIIANKGSSKIEILTKIC